MGQQVRVGQKEVEWSCGSLRPWPGEDGKPGEVKADEGSTSDYDADVDVDEELNASLRSMLSRVIARAALTNRQRSRFDEQLGDDDGPCSVVRIYSRCVGLTACPASIKLIRRLNAHHRFWISCGTIRQTAFTHRLDRYHAVKLLVESKSNSIA